MSRVAQVVEQARTMARRLSDCHRALLLIAAGGLLLRIIWVLWASREPTGIFDPSLYRHSGVHIGSGNGYLSYGDHPTAYYPPGYPYFIGGIYLLARLVGLTGSYTLLIGLVQAVLGALTVLMVGLIAHRIGGKRAGMIAAACFALWPSVVVYTSVILSETLYMFLFAGFIMCIVWLPGAKEQLPDDHQVWKSRLLWLGAVFLALGVLTRPQSALIGIPIVAVIWWVSGFSFNVAAQRGLVLVFVTLLVLMPWTIRNAVQLGGFVPLSNNTGHNLCIGFNPNATGGFMLPDICDQTEPYVRGPEAELEHNSVNQRVALTSIRENWTRLPALSVKKLWYTFNGDTAAVRALESYLDDPFLTTGQRSALQSSATVSYFTILAVSFLTVIGLCRYHWKTRFSHSGFLMLVGLFLGGALVPVLSFGDQRFKDSLYPILAVFVGIGIAHIYENYARKRLLR